MPDLHETINNFLEGSITSIGRDPVIESKSITANGTYTAPEGVDGYSPITVNVPTPTPVIESKTITENGTYTAPSGVDGYSPITVNVPTPTPVIESKSITENGTYTAPSGVDGYSPITVNVPLPQNAYLLKSVANLPQAIASFNDGEDMVMSSLKVAIEPQQEGSGDPSPTNVRSILGWDKCNVTVVGKNLLGGLPLANAIANAGGTLDTANKTVSFSHGNSQVNILDKVKLKENTRHTFVLTYSNTGDNNSLSLFYKISESRYPITLNNSSNTKTTIVYTTPAATIDKLVLNWVLDASTKIYYEESGLFEGELTASDFEPYNGQTYTIDLDGTHYGGEVDVINGIVTPAPYYASYNGETLTGEWISDRDKYEVGATPTIGAQVVNIGASGTPVSILPTAVKSLRGVNNVWADTGDITDAEYFSKEG